MESQSPFITFLIKPFGEILNNFSELLFYNNPSLVLPFVGIGIAVVIFALTQKMSLLQREELFKEKVLKRKELSTIEYKNLQRLKKYAKFLSLIDNTGIFYFGATLTLLITITYPFPHQSPTTHLYNLFANISFIFVFLPTALITYGYIRYKLARLRIAKW